MCVNCIKVYNLVALCNSLFCTSVTFAHYTIFAADNITAFRQPLKRFCPMLLSI